MNATASTKVGFGHSETKGGRPRNLIDSFYASANPEDSVRLNRLIAEHGIYKKALTAKGYFSEPEQKAEFETMMKELKQRYSVARTEVFRCVSFQTLSLQMQLRIAVRLFRVLA